METSCRRLDEVCSKCARNISTTNIISIIMSINVKLMVTFYLFPIFKQHTYDYIIYYIILK